MADGGGASFSDGISPNISILENLMHENAVAAMTNGASEMLNWAQSNAPWADRTGMARAGLEIDVDEGEDEIVVTIYHTVDYGLWLEVIQGGRFGILLPTIEQFGPRMISDAGGTMTGESEGE